MSDRSKIEWCDATWNPLYGCTRVSEGCRHCYAEGLAARFCKPGQWGEGLTRDGRWTGKVTLAEAKLTQPLRWRKPRRIFVNSLSDLFHPNVPDEWIDRVFAVMALCPQHTFIVLTKRPARMRDYCRTLGGHHERDRVSLAAKEIDQTNGFWWTIAGGGAHLPNVWLGVSIENQQAADERIPDLLDTPAAVRIVSAEPLLGPVDLRQWQHDYGCGCGWGGNEPQSYCNECGWRGHNAYYGEPCPECGETLADYNACPECDGHDGDGMSFGPNSRPRIDGVIVGGESGQHARPMHPDWARSLRDQCAAAGVPFFFKQWGEWAPRAWKGDGATHAIRIDGHVHAFDHSPDSCERASVATPNWHGLARVGKTAAGRLLDGRTHDDLPLASKDAAE